MTAPHDDWWASLNHGGLLIAPAKIPTHFPDAPPPLPHWRADRLRRDVVRMLDDESYMGGFLDQVFESLLELPTTEWLKAADVGAEWSHAAVTGEAVRPRRVWRGPNGEALPLFATDGKWGRGAPRIGVGKGRRAVSRVIEWLRNAGREVAVLTNGRQIRLIHAGADYDAFCEWDIELWFDEGAPGPQVTALRRLLGRPALLAPTKDARSSLLEAIHESRRGQGELSAVLGERVRQAVELLIRSSSSQLDPVVADGKVAPNDAYIAATRIVMRLVVVLFAEARELLPRVDPIYHGSYGLQGLREELDREAGGKSERLRHRHSGWPRLLGLFRLVYRGSSHGDLQVPEYGGGLFQPGDPNSQDAIARALAAFESPKNALTDDVVHRMIELLTRSRVKVRQGRGSTWVEAPVDFSDLSSEYIGILYEGLLDYELRRAPTEDPMVFLSLGNQPALPLSRLDAMTSAERKELLKQLKKEEQKLKKGAGAASDDAPADDEEEETEEEVDEEENEDETAEDGAGPDGGVVAESDPDRDAAQQYREMVDIWARNAVRDAGWVKRGADLFDDDVTNRVRALVGRVVLPGEWFLVRWGGTRKGAGTFYTRPQLAGPTTRRTLEPLAYRAVRQTEDPETGLVDVEQWEPRRPEEILRLRVCDPAMGSGSFLISALRYLAEALFESLHHHKRLEPKGAGTIARLADGVPADHPSCETLPVPIDHESFEDRLLARLKRHVVERCIYGVDIDPVAVELARLALWIETMDRTLPFEFLDHKLKAGNSLVGCWFDRFQDYPIRAWDREGGDQKHDRFVHHFRDVVVQSGKRKGETERRGDPWTQAIKDRRDEVRAELASVVSSSTQPSFRFGDERKDAEAVHAEARAAFEKLHGIPVHDAVERARFYAEHLANNPALRSLRASFDLWCALWFWPGDEVALAPGPRAMHDPGEDARRTVARVAEQHRFFHWELEYPDVFDRPGAGFDAMLGNPPWDIQKPSSKEFFSNHDPLYRSYGKQDALRTQSELFERDATIEHGWVAYQARFRGMSNWVTFASDPFGDPVQNGEDNGVSLVRGKDNARLHAAWRSLRVKRRGFADPAHPFRHQGSADLNTYKLFLEAVHAGLAVDGHIGMVVPSGVYTDQGTTKLRELFLGKCRWLWLFGFENRSKIFDIDSRFKFASIIVQKGGKTTALRSAFMRRSLGEWDTPRPRWIAYPRKRVEQFSPGSKAILEISSERDLDVLQKLYASGVLLGDQSPDGWGLQYAREFDMTNDSKLFPPRPKWEASGYVPDEYGHWLKGGWTPYSGNRGILERPRNLILSRDGQRAIRAEDIEDVALPLYEGRMIGQFDFSEKGWVSGKGRSALWEPMSFAEKQLAPQYCMSAGSYLEATDREGNPKALRGTKLGFLAIGSATNQRTMFASTIFDMPCGNAVPVMKTRHGARGDLSLALVLNSLAFDFAMRARLGGLNLNYFVVAETPVLSWDTISSLVSSAVVSASLGWVSPLYACAWRSLKDTHPELLRTTWRSLWALTEHERTRIRAIADALVAAHYGLNEDDLRFVLDECDRPVDSAGYSNPKGFWRMDRSRPPELRRTVLTMVAFRELQRLGMTAFASMNGGAGWLLPDTLRLADYELGHDDRAKEHQPVASALGPRFYDWQTSQDAAESWEECERHAELLGRILPLPATSTPTTNATTASADTPKAGTTDLFGNPVETDLFGNPVETKMKRGRR
ncbi:MAG: DNA methyltransferase [Sandaracinus sp.]